VAALCAVMRPAAAGAQTATAADLDAVLDSARTALGAAAFAGEAAVELTGRSDVFGLDSAFSLLIDGSGRFVRRTDGPLGLSSGYDGSVAWEVNFARTPRILELGDFESALVSAWLMTGWWLAAEAPMDFEMAASDDESVQAITYRLRGGRAAGRIELDRSTWLPRAAEFDAEGTPQRVQFDGYQNYGGLRAPRSLRIDSESGITTTITINAAVPRPDSIEAAVAPPTQRPGDVRFGPDVPLALHVERAPTGHLMVKASIDGAEVDGWFFFDTGAGATCISTPVARALDLEQFGKVAAHGIGGYEDAHFYRPRSFTVGPLTVERPVLAGIDLSFIEQAIGIKVAGIIGYDTIARCVVEFDGAGAAIALHDPAEYALPEGAAWQHVYLYSGHPGVRARFDGHDGVFKIDTGAVGTVTFHARAVERLRLLDGRDTTASASAGVGGHVTTRKGTIEYFELGGRRFEEPTVSFAIEQKGAFADVYIDGNLGSTFLEPFIMVLDYPNRRIAFVGKP
jgi:predicted aspartyl protease